MRSNFLRVVILTWEYPPRIVGEIATYTQSLGQNLSKKGFETHVVTYNESLTGLEREPSGVIVHRVSNPVKTHLNILTWALTLSTEFERVCSDIQYDVGPIDLFDCQEWISVPAVTCLSAAFHIPYIMTLHSLEEQRNSNPNNPISLAIRHFENLGAQSSAIVLVKSKATKKSVMLSYNLDEEKVQYLPQGFTFWVKIAKIYSSVNAGSRS